MAIANPINAQRIVDRFKQLVTDVANSGIVWGTGALPTYPNPTNPTVPITVVAADQFGGTTAGQAIATTGAGITPANNRVTASNIVSALVAETNRYTRIRRLRAQLTVTGGGGNRPAGPVRTSSPGIVYDETNVAHLTSADGPTITAPNPATYNIQTGRVIDDDNLENYFTALKDAYAAIRETTVLKGSSVCHASCHNSCHGSRSRR